MIPFFRLFTILFCLCVCTPSFAAAFPTQGSENIDNSFLIDVEGRVERNSFLRGIELEWIWEHEGYVILVQKSPGMTAKESASIALQRSADSREMNQVMRDGLAKDMRLSMRGTSQRMVLAVLDSPAELAKYAEASSSEMKAGHASHYDVSERLLAICKSPSADAKTDRVQMAERHDRAMQVVHGYSARKDLLPGPYWLYHGLANEVSGNNDLERTKAAMGEASYWGPYSLCVSIQNDVVRPVTLPDLSGLFRVSSDEDVLTTAEARASKAKLRSVQPWFVNRDYQATAGSFFRYLYYDAAPELKKGIRGFTDAAMKGRLRQKPFEDFFGDVNWVELESDFWSSVWARREKEAGSEGLNRGGLQTLLLSVNPEVVLKGPREAAPIVAPVSLLGLTQDLDVQLALAGAAILSGDADGAAKRLEQSLQGEREAASQGRLETELARVNAWIGARDGYLNHLVDSKGKLTTLVDGKKFSTVIAKIEGGELILASNKRKLNSLSVGQLNPVELAKRMSDRKSGYNGGWSVAYPAVLDPKVKATRWLRGTDPDLAQLAADHKSDYPARQVSRRAAEHLLPLISDVHLGQVARPEIVRLEQLNLLWKMREEVSWIPPMRAALEYLASVQLVKVFDNSTLTELLNVEARVDAEGYLNLAYDFSDVDQIRDWSLNFLRKEYRRRWPQTTATKNSLAIQNGKLYGIGKVSRSHVLSFAGPHSIRFSFKTVRNSSVGAGSAGTARVSLCWSPVNSYVGVYDSLAAETMNGPTNDFAFKKVEGHRDVFDQAYQRELRHDGSETVTVLSDGQEVHQLPCNERLSGFPQIMIHSDYEIEIDNVEIRGKLSEGAMEGYRRKWVKRQLRAMELTK